MAITHLDLSALLALPVSFEPLEVRTGFDVQVAPQAVAPDRFGAVRIVIPEIERVEIAFGSDNPPTPFNPNVIASHPAEAGRRGDHTSSSVSGYMVVGEELRPLPIGSHLDRTTGIFTWAPGPGFLGTYRLLFVVKDGAGMAKRIPVTIVIKPKS